MISAAGTFGTPWPANLMDGLMDGCVGGWEDGWRSNGCWDIRWMDAWMHEWMGNFPQAAEPNFPAITVVLANFPPLSHSL